MQSRYFSNRSGYDLRHLIEQDLLARASDAEFQAKIFLFHAINVWWSSYFGHINRWLSCRLTLESVG